MSDKDERPDDICFCGDYRHQHPNNGPCALNGLGHGIIGPENKCMQFRGDDRERNGDWLTPEEMAEME